MSESPAAPLSQQEPAHVQALSQKESPIAPLSQWLQLMLAEIARKREDHERARAEAARRELEGAAHKAAGREASAPPTPGEGRGLPSGR